MGTNQRRTVERIGTFQVGSFIDPHRREPMPTTLMIDALNELNHRQRGRAARLERITAAGIPADHESLRRWLSDREDAEHEAADGVYHVCTVRTSSGCDPDLPSRNGIGCRISRVLPRATWFAAGTEASDLDEPLAEPIVSVSGGTCGTGWQGTVVFTLDDLDAFDADTTDQSDCCRKAEDACRRSLLSRRDCVRTRAEAVALASRMLDERAGE